MNLEKMAEKYRDTGFINRGGSGMEIIRAIEEDYKSIRSFYNHVIDNTKGIEKYARGIKGMHPSDSIIGVKREVDQNVIH